MTPCQEFIDLTFKGISAIGSLIVASLAIWGNWFRYKLFPPAVKVDIVEGTGQLGSGPGNKPTFYYHLKVVNSRHSVPAKNCRVILSKVYTQKIDGKYQAIPLVVDSRFHWAPYNEKDPPMEISHEQLFDFVKISEGDDRVLPCLNRFPSNWPKILKKDQRVRFGLVIKADGVLSKEQMFEVAWDGVWPGADPDKPPKIHISEIEPRLYK